MKKTNSKKILSTVLAAILVFSAFSAMCAPVSAATEEEIKQATAKGMEWLAAQQNADGSWGISYKVADTALAVLKFETHAVNQGLSPFDPAYKYSKQVESGLNYLFANAQIVNISAQPAGNPDTNGNGKGVWFGDWQHASYNTGIALMAIVANAEPTRTVNVPGSPVDGWTFKAVAQDVVDYLAWGQTDRGFGRGGWNYVPMDNAGDRSDNSNTGWVTLGLAYAEHPVYKFKCIIPDFVKSELNIWIDYIQNDVNGDPDDGGSGYTDPNEWVNILKTGNLLQQMAFYGDSAETQRVKDAINYTVRHWNDTFEPGWRGTPACYHATYTVMKGLESLGIDKIDDIDWFGEISDVLVAQQNADGSWPQSCWDLEYDVGGNPIRILSTEWALLTLEKVAPPPPPPAPPAPVPTLTPIEIVALVGLLSVIAALSIGIRKRR